MREKEPAENTCPPVAFLESQMLYVAEPEMGPRSTVSKSQLLYDREWNEIMVQHRAGPPVLLALASPQPSHRARRRV